MGMQEDMMPPADHCNLVTANRRNVSSLQWLSNVRVVSKFNIWLLWKSFLKWDNPLLWTHGSNLNIFYLLEVSKATSTLPKEVGEVHPLGFWIISFHLGLSLWLLMSESMCGCGCSIISSLMKRLGRTACCSDLLSCSHTSEHLQRLAIGCPPRRKVILSGFVGDTFKLKEASSGGFGGCSNWWYFTDPV